MLTKLLGNKGRHVKYNLSATINYIEALRSFGCTYDELIYVISILRKAQELIDMVDEAYGKVRVDDNLDF